MSKIYLVSVSCGNGYDSWDTPLRAFNSIDKAKEFIDACQLLKEYNKDFYKVVEEKYGNYFLENQAKVKFPKPLKNGTTKQQKKQYEDKVAANQKLFDLNQKCFELKNKFIQDNYNPPEECKEALKFLIGKKVINTNYCDDKNNDYQYEEIELE